MPVARNTARIAASRRCANVLPRHALPSLESSTLVKNGTGFSLTAGARSLAMGSAISSSSASQRKNCRSDRYCWRAYVRLAVAAQQPCGPPLDILRVHLLPPGLIRLAEQVGGGEPQRCLGVDPDRPGRFVLRRQMQPERGDISRERPRVQSPGTKPAPVREDHRSTALSAVRTCENGCHGRAEPR